MSTRHGGTGNWRKGVCIILGLFSVLVLYTVASILTENPRALSAGRAHLYAENFEEVIEKEKSSNDTVSRHRIPRKGDAIMNESLTSSLWSFSKLDDQQLYLYEEILKKKWNINQTNVERFRNELSEYSSILGDRSLILLHQENAKLKKKLGFIYTKSAKPVSSFYNLLPKTDPYPSTARFRSCAVVGNSGSLLHSGCGASIDHHDYVFRCNLIPLRPFTEDAGSKNNFTTCNPSIVVREYGNLKTSKDIQKFKGYMAQYNGLLWVPCFHYAGGFPTIVKLLKQRVEKNYRFVCGNPDHFKSTIDFWADRQFKCKLSTGFYLVTMAIQLCDEVHLYGFWPFSEHYGHQRKDLKYHYFDNRTVEAKTHEMDTEFNILMQLNNLGVVHMNGHTCL